MPARTTSILLISSAAVAAAAVASWLVFTMPQSASQAKPIMLLSTVSLPVTPEQTRLALYRLGLDPTSLAAAGVSGTPNVNTVVSNVRTQLSTNPEMVAAADAAVGAARQTVADLEHRIQSGAGNAQDLTNLASARSNLASASDSRTQSLDGLFNAGASSLSETQRGRLSAIRANRDQWTLPTEFLTVTRSESQWVALRDALAHEHIATKRNQQVDPAVQQALAAARSDGTVAAAISGLATNLASIESAWNAATASAE